MAKGQQRSSREAKKPKKQKSAVKPEAPAGLQVKQIGKGPEARGKPKGRG